MKTITKRKIAKVLDNILDVIEKCGGPGSGVPGPCPIGSKPSDTSQKPKGFTAKLIGDKKEGAELLKAVDDADSAFGGKLLPFLEKHPLGSINVGKTPTMGTSNGIYNPAERKLTVKPSKQQGGNAIFDSDDIFTVVNDKKGEHKQNQETTFIHELGHHVALQAIKAHPQGQVAIYRDVIIKGFQEDQKKVSRYAESQPHEYFAESFAAYRFAPEKLSPTAKKMVETVLGI